jgi:hypothetical protein
MTLKDDVDSCAIEHLIKESALPTVTCILKCWPVWCQDLSLISDDNSNESCWNLAANGGCCHS